MREGLGQAVDCFLGRANVQFEAGKLAQFAATLNLILEQAFLVFKFYEYRRP